MSGLTIGYFKADSGNVGDDINPWLARRMLPDVTLRDDAGSVMVGVGSILVADRWDGYARKIVMGAGARARARLPLLDESWDVRFVRGPRSQAAIGRPDIPFITDPGLLVGQFVTATTSRSGIGIVPYYQSSRTIWRALAAACGARIISPLMTPDAFFAALAGCEAVLCEAMHGAIFADALRIPWRAVSFQNRRFEGETHVFKWSDWCESVDLTFDPLRLPINPTREARAASGRVRGTIDQIVPLIDAARTLRRAVREGRFAMSSEPVYNDRIGRLQSAFAALNREFAD